MKSSIRATTAASPPRRRAGAQQAGAAAQRSADAVLPALTLNHSRALAAALRG